MTRIISKKCTSLAVGLTMLAMAGTISAQDIADNAAISNIALSQTDSAIIARVDAGQEPALMLLEEIVNINSGTLNTKGVRKVGKVFEREFKKIEFQTRWIEMPKEMARAGHFVATRSFGNDPDNGPHILLIGHLDTVFEPNSPFQLFERDGDIAKGPGIGDMKGGDIVVLAAMKALVETNALNQGRVTVFFTGDEESVGFPIETARRELIEISKSADFALNFEGMSPGFAVIGRRGSSNWSLEATAPQSHSSGIFNDQVGAGAVFELARILNRFYGEVRGPFGLTFNPGVIAGGTLVEQGQTVSDQTVHGKGNVVANKAVAHGGLRFMSEAQKQAARNAMSAIVEDHLPQTNAVITFEDRYPAMEETAANKALLDRLNAVHARLGLEPVASFPPEKRGAADISFVAPFVTGMDGLGVDGQGAHSPLETMEIASMRFATRRAALLIHDLITDSQLPQD